MAYEFEPPVNFEPPGVPEPIDGPPAPPSFAARLVAEAGFVVYEAGTSVLDEPVLVYRAQPRKQWPDFDVFDHVGRSLAVTRGQGRRPIFNSRRRSTIFDLDGSELLGVRPLTKAFSLAFEVSGAANARFANKGTGRVVTMTANRERFGSIVGSRFRGLFSNELMILDHDECQVGVIRVISRGTLRKIDDYVISIDPTLTGPLRSLIIAAPSVVAMIRRAKQQAAS